MTAWLELIRFDPFVKPSTHRVRIADVNLNSHIEITVSGLGRFWEAPGLY